MSGDPAKRVDEPMTLAEQMFVWDAWRSGEPVWEIALVLRRRVKQVRAILFGEGR